LAKLKQDADLWLTYFAARKIRSVSLDGCTFNVEKMPNSPMKLALLRDEYEEFERRAVLQYVRPEFPVVELGGCIGVVSCVTNRILLNPKMHVVVEPSPSVIPLLQDNRDLNHCEFEILNRAIAYDRPSVTFAETADYWGNALKSDVGKEMVTVSTTCLGDILAERGFQTFTLICDIEGHEYDLIQREGEALQRADTIILETHARMIGVAKTQSLLSGMRELGFHMVEEGSLVVVLRRSPLSD
jgi:FkbM family methyltransferase